MMEMQVEPAQLLCEFRLDDHVPADHLLRPMDRFLELDRVRSQLEPSCSSIGRPAIDPELMMRMLIAGYCMGIRRTDHARQRKQGDELAEPDKSQ